MEKQKYESVYTLQGTQPYVLTSNWPRGFTPNMCEYVPDFSLQNIQSANDVSQYHSVNFSSRIITKENRDIPNSKYAYETKPLNKC